MTEAEEEYVYGVAVGDLDRVRSALDQGVPVNAPLFGHGATVLVWAIGQDEAMVRFLLERGAPVNAADWEGVTPLHNAVRCGTLAIVRLLLEHGSDPRHRTPWGTAREVAERDGREDVAALLRQIEDAASSSGT